MRHLMHLFLDVLLLNASGTAHAEDATGYGVELEGFPYPYAVEHFRFTSQGLDLQMGYMDVKPKSRSNGHAVVLMHGKNFCGATSTAQYMASSKVLPEDTFGLAGIVSAR